MKEEKKIEKVRRERKKWSQKEERGKQERKYTAQDRQQQKGTVKQ